MPYSDSHAQREREKEREKERERKKEREREREREKERERKKERERERERECITHYVIQIRLVLDVASRSVEERRDYDRTCRFLSCAFQPTLLGLPELSLDPEAPLKQVIMT